MSPPAAALRVPALVVLGGAEAGTFAARQLLRARDAGRLSTERILVVDRDPHCAAAGLVAPLGPLRLEVAEWGEWLDAHLEGLPSAAHVVPYHWAPHLFYDWLARQAQRRGFAARKGPVPQGPAGVPFSRATRGGDRALSYATWTCPPTCIEPALCPHTRGAKDWSLCADLESDVAPVASPRAPIVFRCLHLVYGVGTVPVEALLVARDRVLEAAAHGASMVVATSSHCHALAATLETA